MRRSRRGTLPRDRAGDRIHPLFQNADAGIQPVAVAVQRVDGGGQTPRFALAFPGDGLNLLRLSRQIGGGDLVAPRSDRRLVGVEGDGDGGDRTNRPRPEPPERAPVEFIFLGQESRQHAAGILCVEAISQIVGILCH